MAIIQYSKDSSFDENYLTVLPDQFLTTAEKQKDSYIKNTTDYFANKAYLQYVKAQETFVKNYGLIKGILTPEDFYQDIEIKSFTEMLLPSKDLPKNIQHYSIMTTPLNELVGEVSKRPDLYKSKAFDDDSKSEELSYKSELLQKFVLSKAKEKIYTKALEAGEEIPEEELEQMFIKQVEEDIDNYTSVAEKYSNKILECQKVDFNMKEKGEDAFRDLGITAREFALIYEDNSKLGYNIEIVNPANAWYLSTPNKKYTSDPTGRAQGAYAGGTIQVMELSEIIELIPDLTKEEIDHLRSKSDTYGSSKGRSNFNTTATGSSTITYDTKDPLVEQHNLMLEYFVEQDSSNQGLEHYLGVRNSDNSTFNTGSKFVVMRAYCLSKKKIGKVSYLDEAGNLQSSIVDDTYKSKDMPTETSLSWGWVNQWEEYIKIGTDIYKAKPFKLLNYLPLIGTIFEAKNTQIKSFVDLMKPFQATYNLALNQMWRLLEKEMGRVQLMSLRHVPIPKDGDGQDSIDIWESEARDRGVVFIDDSPENMKSPSSFNQFTALDLTRSQELQSRYTIAQQMKNECWELSGMSRQRLGSTTASETATGLQTALDQSYNQTEPLFVAHEYWLGQVYQAIVDASLYIASSKPESTISFINSEGVSSFMQVNGKDLKFRDIKVFLTNRKEDNKLLVNAQQMGQAILQNGGSMYEVLELNSNNSMRSIRKTFKELKEKVDAEKQQAQQMQQQQLEQQQQQSQAQLAQVKLIEEERLANDNLQKDLDRINKKEVAAIQSYARNDNALVDTNKDGVADSLQMTTLANERMSAQNNYDLKLKEIQAKMMDSNNKKEIENNKLQVARENQKNDLQIAKENSKNRNKK